MWCRVVACLIALTTILTQSAGELIIAPRNTESKVGDTTYFNCSTDLESEEIFWYHNDKYIYNGFGILEPYDKRFEIDRNASNGSHNLVIYSVESEDAGKYICVDDDGLGTRRSAELVVLDDDPECRSNMHLDGVIGQNVFNIPPDEVRLTCNVTYHGNIPPQMEWKKVGDKGSSNYGVMSSITSSNRLIYTLKFKGDIALDNSSFVCQTTRSTQNQYTCPSETINVLYFFKGSVPEQKIVRGTKITCAASNTTFPCSSQWYHSNDSWYHSNDSCVLSCDETITTHLLGEYLCMVKCFVRGTEYFEALNVFIVQAEEPPGSLTLGEIAVLGVVPIIVISILSASIAAIVVQYKRRNAKEHEKEGNLVDHILFGTTEGIGTSEPERINAQPRSGHVNQDDQLQWSARCGPRSMGESFSSVDRLEEEFELKKEVGATSVESDIIGAALLNGELFLVRKQSSKLEVYDFSEYGFTRELKVKKLLAAVDICCCKKNNCLYIMDKKIGDTRKEVLKVTADGKLLLNWQTKNNTGGHLSVTMEGNLIVTVQESHMIYEYSPDGGLRNAFTLHGSRNPWHAIEMDKDLYVVCHGLFLDPLHRVCLVTREGNTGLVEKSFGGKKESSDRQLEVPYYLAVGRLGYIIVAEPFHNRMVLIDRNFKFKANIVPKCNGGFRYPRRVYLDEKNEKLIVIAAGDTKKDDSGKGTEEDGTSTENQDLLRDTEEGKIRKDWRILVFNMEPLLKKYSLSVNVH